jgi:hypothetical protein
MLTLICSQNLVPEARFVPSTPQPFVPSSEATEAICTFPISNVTAPETASRHFYFQFIRFQVCYMKHQLSLLPSLPFLLVIGRLSARFTLSNFSFLVIRYLPIGCKVIVAGLRPSYQQGFQEFLQ